jgi:hypothetical protein
VPAGFDVGVACVVVVAVVLDFDFEPDVVPPDAITVGLPVSDFVGFPLVAGLPVVRDVVVDATGLPVVVGFPAAAVLPALVGFPPPAVFPTVVGFPALVGLPCFEGLLAGPANAGDNVRDAAARKPRIVAETRIRVTSKGHSRGKQGATRNACFSAEIRSAGEPCLTILCRSYGVATSRLVRASDRSAAPFVCNGFERVEMLLRTGHVDRPDILIAARARQPLEPNAA